MVYIFIALFIIIGIFGLISTSDVREIKVEKKPEYKETGINNYHQYLLDHYSVPYSRPSWGYTLHNYRDTLMIGFPNLTPLEALNIVRDIWSKGGFVLLSFDDYDTYLYLVGKYIKQ